MNAPTLTLRTWSTDRNFRARYEGPRPALFPAWASRPCATAPGRFSVGADSSATRPPPNSNRRK